MTVQEPQDSGGGQPPAAEALDNDKTRHANSTAGKSLEDVTTKIKREEVVFVLRTPGDKTSGYLTYSLAEGSTSDGEKPFDFKIVQCEQHQLPEDLSGFVLNQGSLPPAHLSPPHEVHVVVSTHSGLQLGQGFYQTVLRPLLGAVGLEPREAQDGGGYQVTVTESADTIRDFAQKLGRNNKAAAKTVILLSGDGGVTDFLNGQDRSPPPPNNSLLPTIALLPLGTGNALFHSLHKPLYTTTTTDSSNPAPSPLVLSLRTLFQGTPSPLPTFCASFSLGAKLISAPTEADDDAATNPTPDTIPSNTPGNTTDNTTTDTTPSQTPNPPEAPTAIPTDAPTTPKTPVTHLIGAVVASYGFHASLVWESDTPAYRVHGAKRFAMAAGGLLKLGHVYEVGVDVVRSTDSTQSEFVGLAPGGWKGVGGEGGEGGEGEGEGSDGKGEGGEGKKGKGFNYVLATLVSNLEKTFAISPESQPLDGRLRLVHFGDVGGAKTMEIMMAAYREGEHVGMPEVGYEDVEELRVTVAEEDPRWRKVCVDGSIVELEKGGWMRVKREQRERVRVLVDAGIAH
ncbi:ATP-NAD kinase-like domain-containing protein [Chaetomium fimeti]|uniref:ATP-NAD kinase-like domain-containing protein n=1 Tax=Chaetomium fimeti TaxID=1854472 RepID=A0AAE0LQY1_9PEZI|nr:ATP-NAD kinase-like domain-containing protein [Chaetomium fimeti]